MDAQAELIKLEIRREYLRKIVRSENRRQTIKPIVEKKSKGRPTLDDKTILKARKLAAKFSIPDVARKLDVSLASLYNYGIKRYLIPFTG
jgi:hypothetical protein